MAQGGWVLSLERFRRSKSVAAPRASDPAVTLKDLNRAALPSRQFYAPDPTENMASVGGTISTNASGSRSFRFGSTRRHVLALRVALMDGSVVEFRRGDADRFRDSRMPVPRTTKYTAGYALRPEMDWIDLFCGAEGTLGVCSRPNSACCPSPKICSARSCSSLATKRRSGCGGTVAPDSGTAHDRIRRSQFARSAARAAIPKSLQTRRPVCSLKPKATTSILGKRGSRVPAR